MVVAGQRLAAQPGLIAVCDVWWSGFFHRRRPFWAGKHGRPHHRAYHAALESAAACPKLRGDAAPRQTIAAASLDRLFYDARRVRTTS